VKKIDLQVKKLLQQGTVIPAHPLVINQHNRIDEERQRALTRYYMACETGGIAVGVHTTQFEIRYPGINLLEPVLKMTSEEIDNAGLKRPYIKVAGICGPTDSALKEARLAVKYGYHLGLLSMGGLADYSEKQLLNRAVAVAAVIPLFGFYLQPAVGGRRLSYDFWRAFAEIPNVQAIKVAAFNRYQTLDVVRAVCTASRSDEIALYTGNDDNIVADLLTPYRFTINGQLLEKRFVGGLLGHWAVWTKQATGLFREIKQCIALDDAGMEKLLATGIEVTDMNAAIFDAANSYKGCIAGIHEVLRRQGLVENIRCLNPEEKLSPGQEQEISRVISEHRHLTDDSFVSRFIEQDRAFKTHTR
jgi:dihydrodipicolinate synthase/N-acetylneuraminate lyase